jgi:predicted DNA-binding transcriptional regulator AlpA
MTATDTDPSTPTAPLLIDISALSKLLSRSVSALERDQAAGRLPPPVRIGGSKRWKLTAIEAWVAAGCPAPGREGNRE